MSWFLVAGLLCLVALIGGLLLIALLGLLAVPAGVAAWIWDNSHTRMPNGYAPMWPADPRWYQPPPYPPPPPPGWGHPHLEKPPVARVIDVRRTGRP